MYFTITEGNDNGKLNIEGLHTIRIFIHSFMWYFIIDITVWYLFSATCFHVCFLNFLHRAQNEMTEVGISANQVVNGHCFKSIP